MKTQLVIACALGMLAGAALGEDKVKLDPPKDSAPVAAIGQSEIDELKKLPDGVQNVRTNPDGSLKSLMIKATVEIEDVLGAQKGRRLAHQDAENQCKQALVNWLKENCDFAQKEDLKTELMTKGEKSKDAAGNTVTIRNQNGTEYKTLSDHMESGAAKCISGLESLYSEVTTDKDPEYVLILGLSERAIAQATSTSAALADDKQKKPADGKTADISTPNNGDKATPEVKVNSDAKEYLR